MCLPSPGVGGIHGGASLLAPAAADAERVVATLGGGRFGGKREHFKVRDCIHDYVIRAFVVFHCASSIRPLPNLPSYVPTRPLLSHASPRARALPGAGRRVQCCRCAESFPRITLKKIGSTFQGLDRRFRFSFCELGMQPTCTR
jgi:hypothetical protein